MNSIFLHIKSRKLNITAKRIAERVFQKKLAGFDKIDSLFQNKNGIEIGGPSNIFKPSGFLPVYPLANRIDGCNFSNYTEWEGEIKSGYTYKYTEENCGYQFICDGVDVPGIPLNTYDFVLSCNNLEHIANPLKALNNWTRLLKDGGVTVLVLPRKESNFDHRRPITNFDHLVNDFKNDTGEDDLTHLNEILEMHDLSLDPRAGSFENFRSRSLQNVENRCLHHHVFDLSLLRQMVEFFNLKVVCQASRVCDHVIIAVKQPLLSPVSASSGTAG